jgi:hypothetical protein
VDHLVTAAAVCLSVCPSGSKSFGSGRDTIETQKSKVPLKWAASDLVPKCSSYTAAFGAHPSDGKQQVRRFQV